MKKDVMLSLFGTVCLCAGFFLFISGRPDLSIVLTLCGILIYLYKQSKKEKD